MDADEIAHKLRAARGTRSQRKAAEDWGVAQQTICYWESGAMFPSRKLHVAIVAQILDVEPEVIRSAGRKRLLHARARSVAAELEALAAEADE